MPAPLWRGLRPVARGLGRRPASAQSLDRAGGRCGRGARRGYCALSLRRRPGLALPALGAMRRARLCVAHRASDPSGIWALACLSRGPPVGGARLLDSRRQRPPSLRDLSRQALPLDLPGRRLRPEAGVRYAVPTCLNHLEVPVGQDCLATGCLARRACPVGAEWRSEPTQAGFHMRAFLRAGRGLGAAGH